ncbi:hypothetical protein FD04_GL001771 [Secundilactobacillus odoratitofui DSM 19909 = JCM 15043]|uniref:DUF2252 domain-containing protein n=1 Tax=Secundilactobacillus odoratitofui DSM 19909 = JCM 15043 TaxID=1423776 RepID=A0A0R1LYT7_9LACO|nr:DUF2252 domain-containing protein [Secundilactobacillus odoratitofui]KRK96919.1 hypothetical protein FD04_GL001771 [Secundilactobacillus odoratitofui DSM 19909 = JCM 15043]
MAVKPINFSQLFVTQSLKKQKKMGKKLRDGFSFADLGEFVPVKRDPNHLMDEVRSILIPELLPERTQRMSQSTFSFFRGTAELMEFDLANQKNSPIHAVICGDAHVGNFGFFGSPERHLLFDLNDFDEADINPFEWDIKRLAVSTLLAGQEHDFESAKLTELLTGLGQTYRESLNAMFERTALNRFYPVNNVETVLDTIPAKEWHTNKLHKFLEKAGKRDSEQVVRKFTITDSQGNIAFKENAPRTRHVTDNVTNHLKKYLERYRQTLQPDVSLMLSQYQVTDIVRHSVGVGSFGSLCYLLLLTGTDDSHLVLQIKEALPHRQLADQLDDQNAQFEQNEGKRIVDCQKILQSATDPFLGYFATATKSFYVRQFRDMKASIDLSALDWDQFEAYAKTCAWVLGISHAQSPTSGLILGYVGHSSHFDDAIAKWSADYTQQVQDDYAAFKQYRLN